MSKQRTMSRKIGKYATVNQDIPSLLKTIVCEDLTFSCHPDKKGCFLRVKDRYIIFQGNPLLENGGVFEVVTGQKF